MIPLRSISPSTNQESSWRNYFIWSHSTCSQTNLRRDSNSKMKSDAHGSWLTYFQQTSGISNNRTATADQHRHRFQMKVLRHLTKPHTERTIITNASCLRNTTDPIMHSVPFFGCSQVARSRYSRLPGNTPLSHLRVREGVSLDICNKSLR
jgi:hypothetical protein